MNEASPPPAAHSHPQHLPPPPHPLPAVSHPPITQYADDNYLRSPLPQQYMISPQQLQMSSASSASPMSYMSPQPLPLQYSGGPYYGSRPVSVMPQPFFNDPNGVDLRRTPNASTTPFMHPHQYYAPYPPPPTHQWDSASASASPFPIPAFYQPMDADSAAMPAPQGTARTGNTPPEALMRRLEVNTQGPVYVYDSNPQGVMVYQQPPFANQYAQAGQMKSGSRTPSPQVQPQGFPVVPKPLHAVNNSPTRVAGVQSQLIKLVAKQATDTASTTPTPPPQQPPFQSGAFYVKEDPARMAQNAPHVPQITNPHAIQYVTSKPEPSYPSPAVGYMYSQHTVTEDRTHTSHEFHSSSSMTKPHIRYAKGLSDGERGVNKRPRRKRSALRADLTFCGLYNDPDTDENCKNKTRATYDTPEEDDEDEAEQGNESEQSGGDARMNRKVGIPPHLAGGSPVHLSRIRVWVDEDRKSFYDCICGKRKPTQDFKKILHHVEGHNVSQFPCEVCGRVFKHHLGRNSHQRVHKLHEIQQAQAAAASNSKHEGRNIDTS